MPTVSRRTPAFTPYLCPACGRLAVRWHDLPDHHADCEAAR